MKPVGTLTLSIALVLTAAAMSNRLQAAKEAKMVMTVLEAKVAPDRINDLESAYRLGTAKLPPEIVETLLVRDTIDETAFRILTVWASRDALAKMRASGEKPKGVQIFEAAGSTPKLSVFDVVVHRRR